MLETNKQDLDPRNKQKDQHCEVLNREVYYKGDAIIHQGDEGYRAYYIEKGRVMVSVQDGSHELNVAELGVGEIFGEMALINHEPRSASVTAIEETVVTVIARDELEMKVKNIEDKAIRALITVLAQRLHAATLGQMMHYRHLADFQDRVTGIVDRVHLGVDDKERDKFREDVEPLLEELQKVLDKYQN